MEIAYGIGIYCFSYPQRVRGALITVRGRIYIFGATRRGFFWRLNGKIFSPYPGHFESILGLRTRVGEVDFLLKAGLRDEVLPVRFRCDWLHGTLFIRSNGLYSININATDPEMLPEIASKTPEDFARLPMEDADFYFNSRKKPDQVAGGENW